MKSLSVTLSNRIKELSDKGPNALTVSESYELKMLGGIFTKNELTGNWDPHFDDMADMLNLGRAISNLHTLWLNETDETINYIIHNLKTDETRTN